MEQANCKCTKNDFECDIGFFKDEDGSCKRFGHDPDKPKKCDGTYMGKPGFRKIQASVCQGGQDLEKEQVERQYGSKEPAVTKLSTFTHKYDHGLDTVFYFPNSDVST